MSVECAQITSSEHQMKMLVVDMVVNSGIQIEYDNVLRLSILFGVNSRHFYLEKIKSPHLSLNAITPQIERSNDAIGPQFQIHVHEWQSKINIPHRNHLPSSHFPRSQQVNSSLRRSSSPCQILRICRSAQHRIGDYTSVNSSSAEPKAEVANFPPSAQVSPPSLELRPPYVLLPCWHLRSAWTRDESTEETFP